MCLIISSQSKEIKKEFLQNGFDSHPHGGGFSYCKDGQLFLEKGFFDFDEYYAAYQKVIGFPIICHQRFKTSGLQDQENCHPFIISEKVHFCHNGVITGFSTKIKDKSDTFAFCENILKPISDDNKNKKWWKNKGFKWFIENAIGKGNKLAFLDNTGKIEIYNEAAGEWVDDEKTIWASNNSYKFVKIRGNYDDDFANGNSHYFRNGQVSRPTLPAPKTLTNPSQMFESPDERAAAAILDADDESEEVFDITAISDDELKEVDEYLRQLNKAVV